MQNTNNQQLLHSNFKILGISVGLYLLWAICFIGIRPDHIYFALFFIGMILFNNTTKKIAISMMFFWIYWIIYDSLRILPNYAVSTVHIKEPYLFELEYFGIWHEGAKLTLNEYFLIIQNTFLDFISGAFYLTWVPLPMAYCIYLFTTDKRMLLSFSACFLFTNLVGFVFYYAYPAAAPWYVHKYGFTENFDLIGDAAGLLRFDRIIGIDLFKNMYTKNANVFAAIPSLHAAYPIVLFYFGLKKKYKILSTLFFIDILGIWFAAMYTSHHYLLDLLLGGLCAIIAIMLYEIFENKTLFSKILDKLETAIS